MLKVGQTVKHENANWNPQGKLTIVKIEVGPRSGLTIITAVDETGKEFTGCKGVFSAT